MCAYCKAHPPAAGEQLAPHTDIRRCPRAGAVCGTCKTISAVCVAGVCRKLCTRCNQVGHAKKHCPLYAQYCSTWARDAIVVRSSSSLPPTRARHRVGTQAVHCIVNIQNVHTDAWMY